MMDDLEDRERMERAEIGTDDLAEQLAEAAELRGCLIWVYRALTDEETSPEDVIEEVPKALGRYIALLQNLRAEVEDLKARNESLATAEQVAYDMAKANIQKAEAEVEAEVEALRMVAKGRDCLLIERSLRENPRKEVVDMIANGLARLRELGVEEA